MNEQTSTNQDHESVVAESQSYFEYDISDVDSVMRNSAVVAIRLYHYLLEEFDDCDL